MLARRDQGLVAVPVGCARLRFFVQEHAAEAAESDVSLIHYAMHALEPDES